MRKNNNKNKKTTNKKSSYTPLKSVTRGRAKMKRTKSNTSPTAYARKKKALDRKEKIHKQQMANKRRREQGLDDPKRKGSARSAEKGIKTIKNYNSARKKDKRTGMKGRTTTKYGSK